jgi:predicted peptidase
MLSIVAPGLTDLHAIMVAADCPWRGWNEPTAEKAVMALLHNVLGEYSGDRRRILVTGYSMGGRGTWFMESHHADLFTAGSASRNCCRLSCGSSAIV